VAPSVQTGVTSGGKEEQKLISRNPPSETKIGVMTKEEGEKSLHEGGKRGHWVKRKDCRGDSLRCRPRLLGGSCLSIGERNQSGDIITGVSVREVASWSVRCHKELGTISGR